MGNPVVEVSNKSWLQRIGESIKGVLVGGVLFLIAFPLLWWNEGRAVTTYRSLNEGAAAVVTVSADEVDPANDGKLVHLTGLATTTEELKDEQFRVSATALHLDRKVAMYQWVETEKKEKRQKVGGGEETITTYSYAREWKDSLVSSEEFRNSEEHVNPAGMAYGNKSWSARNVTVGAFSASDSIKSKIRKPVPVTVDDALLARQPASLRSKLKVHGDGFYLGTDPLAPVVGDLKISFVMTPPTTVSLVSKQTGESFTPYKAEAGGAIELLQVGTVGAAEMFAAAQAANTTLTWILRGGGFLAMLIGLMMIFRPIAMFGAVIPVVGDILSMGTGILAFAIAVPLSLITIGFAWVFYRPVLGIGMLLLAAVILVGVKMLAFSRKEKQPAVDMQPA